MDLPPVEDLKLTNGKDKMADKSGKRIHPVIVIGCGASGIAALSKLAKAGIDAIGLEASDRMGGRINTVDYGANVVDLGAAWCHGEVNNLVYQLASPHNLLGRPDSKGDNDEDWYLLSNGTLMPNGNARTLLNTISEAVDATDKNHYQSISEFVREGVNDETINVSNVPYTEPFLEWYERDNHLGGQNNPMEGKSLKGLIKHEACPGEFWLNWKGKGYKTILDVLLGRHSGTPINVNIQYNTEVTNINWMPLNLDDEDPIPTVLVTCDNGTVLKASRVIITVSLGVLKHSYASMFTPPLPGDKIAAIENLQFCLLDKIYIEFERPWWPEGLVNFRILWRPEDKEQFSQDEKWITEIHGLRIVENQPNLLLAWVYGNGAAMMEKVDQNDVKKGINKLLDKLFRLNFDVAPVKSIKRSQWASNPYVRGSYSYRASNTELCPFASAKVLSEPLSARGVPVVCFGGEATSHKWHNAVHGAIDAGFREADRVLTSLG